MKVTFIPIVIGSLGTDKKGLVQGLEDFLSPPVPVLILSWRTSGDHPNYNIVGICQNPEKGPGGFERIAQTQTLVRNHRIMLV